MRVRYRFLAETLVSVHTICLNSLDYYLVDNNNG